jgi:SAM-dependent methyltransferase
LNIVWVVQEMMFGYRDKFSYFECANCGCLQIEEFPPNLEKYYPRQYYSFSTPVVSNAPSVRLHLKRARMDYILNHTNILGRFVTMLWGTPPMLSRVARADVGPNKRVLDVGCGSGELLLALAEHGYMHLTGVDPYIEEDVRYSNGVTILKRRLEELTEQYDFIMLNHSFEHLWDPFATLKQLHRLLSPNCLLLIRIPTVNSFAWRKYRENWVQLDAPRHLYLHSKRSMELLAGQSGFKLREVEYDSWGIQFWGSEQYVRDVPLMDPRSRAIDKKSPLFTAEELIRFDQQSLELNRRGDGDQAAFYFVRV